MCIDCEKGKKISLCVNWRRNSGRKTRREGGRIVNGTLVVIIRPQLVTWKSNSNSVRIGMAFGQPKYFYFGIKCHYN